MAISEVGEVTDNTREIFFHSYFHFIQPSSQDCTQEQDPGSFPQDASLQQWGTCERAPPLLTSLPLPWSPTHDLVPSHFRQPPHRGVSLPITKLPHVSTTGLKCCNPFHLMSAVTTLNAVDPKPVGILKPLLWVTGSFGSPAGIPAVLEDLFSPTLLLPFFLHFLSGSCFSPSDWQFPVLSSNQENCL